MEIHMEELSRRMVGTNLVDILVNLGHGEEHATDAVKRIPPREVVIAASSHSLQHKIPLKCVVDHVVGEFAKGKPYHLVFNDAPTSYSTQNQGGNAI